MTRQEFCEQITTMSELIDFCNDNGCGICDDIYDEYSYNDYVNDEVVNWSEDWQSLRDHLSNFPDGYDYYRRDDWGEFHGIDESGLDDLISDVIDWGDDNDIWDNEDADEQTENDGDEQDFEDADEEDDDYDGAMLDVEDETLNDLFGYCSNTYKQAKKEKDLAFAKIIEDAKEKAVMLEKEEEDELMALVSAFEPDNGGIAWI